MVHSETFTLSTKGFSDILDITHHVDAVTDRSGVKNGLVTVFCPGSTGSVTTIEYETGALRDLQKAIEKIIPSTSLMSMTNAGAMAMDSPMSVRP